MIEQTPPLDFFAELVWIDGRPLLDTIEPYRRQIFTQALFTFDPSGRPRYNLALTGRGKKNWKSSDLVLAALYRLLIWISPPGNDCYIVANDEDQAGDDLVIAKKLIECNPELAALVTIRAKSIERNDGKGTLSILPARDVSGLHGKTALFVGFDEIHAYKDYGLFEALALDPSRLDALMWITSYASIFHSDGYPLHDFMKRGMRHDDPRMFFAWYSGDYCTDPLFRDLPPEQRANPSMASWGNDDYIEQQRRRLPAHRFRRLHLNMPGMPDGAYFDPGKVDDIIVEGRKQVPTQARIRGMRPEYVGFVDMSGGSSDDAVVGIAHFDPETHCPVLDLLESQTQRVPFDPMLAVGKFAGLLKDYGITHVIGDQYAGNTFASAFVREGIDYVRAELSKHEIYEEFEPLLNSRKVQLLDHPKLKEQLLGLVVRGKRIDHQSGEHDDWANAAAGACVLASKRGAPTRPLPPVLAHVSTDYNPFAADGAEDSLEKVRQRAVALRSLASDYDYDPWADRT